MGGGQARIQDSEGGGGFVHSEGGVRTGISGADPNCCRALGKSTSKKKLQTAVGGGVRSPKKNPCIRACGGANWAESFTTRLDKLVELEERTYPY